MIFNVHRWDIDNLGDMACAAMSYVGFEGKRIERIDIGDSRLLDPHSDVYRNADAFIVGGGGLIHGPWIETLCTLPQSGKPCVAWGIGSNFHGAKVPIHPKQLDSYALVGCRDIGNPWNYVPCPSCLHPAFNVDYGSPRFSFVIYEHFRHSIELSVDGVPRMANRQPYLYFMDVLRFLASGAVVLTNSLHGCYWAMLLGRKPVIWKPQGNRFMGFKEQPPICDETNWEKALDASFRVEGFLDECRKLNREFLKKVEGVLK